MTLLDLPRYGSTKGHQRRSLLIGLFAGCLAIAGFLWLFWDWPEEHLVNQFFEAVEAKDLPKAFGIWNHDPEWQEHPERYSGYNYSRFESDWGRASAWGEIKTHEIVMAKTESAGVVVEVRINGGTMPVFIQVEPHRKAFDFSPRSPALGID